MRAFKISLAALATIGVVAIVGFRIAGDHADGATASASAPAMMAMPVPVVPVIKKTLPIYLDYPGRIESIRSIALQARVSGYIEFQLAPDGADVKSGDLLYQIDPRDLQAALDQANAQAQRDQASLEYARPISAAARSWSKAASSPRTPTTRGRARCIRLRRRWWRTGLRSRPRSSTSAMRKSARLSLAGLGGTMAAKGSLVGPTTGPLNTLVQLDPIYVTFNPSESELADIMTARAAGNVEAEISSPASRS